MFILFYLAIKSYYYAKIYYFRKKIYNSLFFLQKRTLSIQTPGHNQIDKILKEIYMFDFVLNRFIYIQYCIS